jgi:hypothetical protein
VSHLPRLNQVKLVGFTTFDLEQTKSLFHNNGRIEKIWIENAQWYYDDDDDDDDEENLDEDSDCEDHNRYEHFLGYLVSMTKNRLCHLRIEIPEKLSHGANIASLLSGHSKLESLVIENTTEMSSAAPSVPRAVPAKNDRKQKFAAAMAALQSNNVLKTLDIDFHVSFSEFRDVASMLKHNKTLTKLCLRLETLPGTIHGVNDGINHIQDDNSHFVESIQLFFEALKTNTKSSLKEFSQYNIDSREFRLAASANRDAHSSTSVQSMTGTKRVPSLIEIGLDMLRYNLSLEHFSFFLFDPNDPNLTKKKELFLRLNKRGRRSVQHRDIRETLPKSSLVDQLSKHSMDDLDGLYYYISANPFICRTIKQDATRSHLNKIHTLTMADKKTKKRDEASVKGDHTKHPRDSLRSSMFDREIFQDCSQRKRQRFDDMS